MKKIMLLAIIIYGMTNYVNAVLRIDTLNMK